MKRIVMLAVLALAACGGSDGDGGGGTGGTGGEGPKCELPAGLNCRPWWPDWPDKTREGTWCLPEEQESTYQCWFLEERLPTCELGNRSAIFIWFGDDEAYFEDCVPADKPWLCTIPGGTSSAPERDPITYTPIECLRPWDA